MPLQVKSYIAMGEKLPGVKAIHCSKLPSDPTLKDGFFIRPVIFTEIDNVCRLSREEIFGPVTCVIRFSSFDEAIKMANDTDFGLAASIWTRDLKNALQVCFCASYLCSLLNVCVVTGNKASQGRSGSSESELCFEPQFPCWWMEAERTGSRSVARSYD
jgi:acyl-CoA reductase-like NAD-dependent aldehyde dehydrogenase